MPDAEQAVHAYEPPAIADGFSLSNTTNCQTLAQFFTHQPTMRRALSENCVLQKVSVKRLSFRSPHFLSRSAHHGALEGMVGAASQSAALRKHNQFTDHFLPERLQVAQSHKVPQTSICRLSSLSRRRSSSVLLTDRFWGYSMYRRQGRRTTRLTPRRHRAQRRTCAVIGGRIPSGLVRSETVVRSRATRSTEFRSINF